MGRFFRRIRGAADDALGLQVLPAGNKRFIATHFNFLLFTTIPGVFINTFFFRQDGKISTVAIYTAIACFGSAVFMQLSSYISIRRTPVFVMRVGVVLYNIFYLVLLLLQNRAVRFMPLLGLLSAVASSFYWQAYNTLLQDLTDSTNLSKTISVLGICNAAVTLVIPVLSGYVISCFQGITGYMVIFLCSFILSLFTSYLAARIPYSKHRLKSNLLGTYVRIFKTNSWRLMFFSEAVRGIREISFSLFLSIAFFKMIENESVLGLNTMVCGLATIIAYYFVGKSLRERNRVRFVMVSTFTMLVLFLILFIRLDATVLFIASVFNAVAAVGITMPSITTLFGMFDDLGGDVNFTQIMAAHEIFLATGRVIGLILVIFLSVTSSMYVYAFLLLNLTAILAGVLLKFSIRAHGRERKADGGQ